MCIRDRDGGFKSRSGSDQGSLDCRGVCSAIKEGGTIGSKGHRFDLTDALVGLRIENVLKFAEAIVNCFGLFQAFVHSTGVRISFSLCLGNEIIKKVGSFLKCILTNFLECSLTLTKLDLGSAKRRAVMWIPV